jgi:hypothetical protein
MTTYEVKMGVPLPDTETGRKRTPLRAAVEGLPVGGMIECGVLPINERAAAYAMLSQVRRKLGRNFQTRILANGALGIWRTA